MDTGTSHDERSRLARHAGITHDMTKNIASRTYQSRHIERVLRTILMYFIIYAFIGWLYEGFIWIFKENQIMNRGFLYGPWLPIYGFGGILLYATTYGFAKKPLYVKMAKSKINIKPFLTFLLISAGAAAIELTATFIMQLCGLDFKILWHYDEYRINFQQRIALIPALQFGVHGVIILYKDQNGLNKFILTKNRDTTLAQWCIITLFFVDVIIHIFTGSTYTDVPLLYL